MKKVWKSPYTRRDAGFGLMHSHRLAAASSLANLPLLEGLEQLPGVTLEGSTAADMRFLLCHGIVDAALLPCIDLQRADESLIVLPAGCVSSAGTALTCRVFSHVRPKEIQTLWVDSEAHTATALAQVLWHFLFKRRLNIIPFTPGAWDPCDDAQAVLIGTDHAVSQPPLGYDYQFDLGRMWFEMTGLPFVFDVWAANGNAHCAELSRVLAACRRDGQDNLHEIARRHAATYDWPQDLAERYLSSYMLYEFTDAHREGMEEFFELAAESGAIDLARTVQYQSL